MYITFHLKIYKCFINYQESNLAECYCNEYWDILIHSELKIVLSMLTSFYYKFPYGQC